MYCSKCGNKIEGKGKFCPKCGESIVGNNNGNVNNNGNDISLILGIICIFFCYMPIISIPVGIAAIINGKKKKNADKASPGFIMGIVGIVLSVIIVLIVCAFVFYFFVGIFDDDWYDDDWYYDSEYYYDDIDTVSGYVWASSDGVILYLNSNMSFEWYFDEEEDNNYYKGNYSVYIGNDAIEYISDNLSQYGITRDDQIEWFRYSDYDLDEYYLIILNCTTAYVDGSDDADSIGLMYYYGFYDDDLEKLSLTNMDTLKEINFYLDNSASSRYSV